MVRIKLKDLIVEATNEAASSSYIEKIQELVDDPILIKVVTEADQRMKAPIQVIWMGHSWDEVNDHGVVNSVAEFTYNFLEGLKEEDYPLDQTDFSEFMKSFSEDSAEVEIDGDKKLVYNYLLNGEEPSYILISNQKGVKGITPELLNDFVDEVWGAYPLMKR